jgi:hypothetical protein
VNCPLCGSPRSSCHRCGAVMCQNGNCSAGHRCSQRFVGLSDEAVAEFADAIAHDIEAELEQNQPARPRPGRPVSAALLTSVLAPHVARVDHATETVHLHPLPAQAILHWFPSSRLIEAATVQAVYTNQIQPTAHDQDLPEAYDAMTALVSEMVWESLRLAGLHTLVRSLDPIEETVELAPVPFDMVRALSLIVHAR